MATTPDHLAAVIEPPSGARSRPARLADMVVVALVDSIVSGRIGPGESIPPESSLAETFHVSRITVREAVKALQSKGLVDVRQGIGALVQDDARWNLLDPLVLAAAVQHDTSLTTLDELIGVRVALESHLAHEAARSATATDLAEIEEIFHVLEEQISVPQAFIETDLRFHDRIMQAAGNRLARAIISTVHDPARTSLDYQGHPSVADVTKTNREHREILERILARDAQGAQAAMTKHIRAAWARRRPARTGAAAGK